MVDKEATCDIRRRNLSIDRPTYTNLNPAYLMDEVRCTGAENRLTDCQFAGWGIHDCKQNEEVGVKCAYEAPIVQRSVTNPLSIKLRDSELMRMRS
ncbi:hypothetical protein X801_02269, partial [Opisthorchis viverrini]